MGCSAILQTTSLLGGNEVTINGTGFALNSVVTLESDSAFVRTSSLT